MCNAHNHPSNCKCGWGGEGHLGKSATGLQIPRYFFDQNIDAFTIPKVRCQHCGGKVFYYENTNGSKVFFDFLGPPWPKHSCEEYLREINPIPNWEILYRPYCDAAPNRAGVVKVEGYLGDKRLSLFSKIGAFSPAPNLRSGCVYVKRNSVRSYDIQYIDGETGLIKKLRAGTSVPKVNKRRR